MPEFGSMTFWEFVTWYCAMYGNSHTMLGDYMGSGRIIIA